MEGKERSDSQDEEIKDETFIDRPAILDKYKAVSIITNEALKKVISLCKVGADIHTIC